MLKDLFSAVQKSLSDRVRDPLLGGFLGFFLLWNWKPIALLLFGADMVFEDRLAYVQDIYHFPKAHLCGAMFPYADCAWEWRDFLLSIGWSYLMPAGLTMAYIGLYPFLKQWIVVYVQKRETKILNAKREEEKAIALTPEMSARLQSDLDRLKSSLEKANREKYDLPRIFALALKGAAHEEGGSAEHFQIAFAQMSDSETIKEGHWMVFDLQTQQVTYFALVWKKEYRACMVTHRLDGLMVVVQVFGSVDWSRWAKMWNMTLTGNGTYILSERTKGAIRKAETKDRRFGDQFIGFVGYSELDGSRLNLRDIKKE